ncbi:MAG: preprotein translocase, YajC subunit [Thermoleophilia bacterium]|nr:preprotein translocase, YajC subunit [Thermoleophilia bacterium]
MLPLLVLLGTIAGAWYLLIVRPQKDQQTRHGRLVERLQVGDHVLTVGGIYGRVVAVEASSVVLELAPGLTSRIATDGIARIVHGGEAALPTNANTNDGPPPAAPSHDQVTEPHMHQQPDPNQQPQPMYAAPQLAPQPQPQPQAGWAAARTMQMPVAQPMPVAAYAAPLAYAQPAPVAQAPAELPAPPPPATTTLRAQVLPALPTFEPRPWGDVAPAPRQHAPAQSAMPILPPPPQLSAPQGYAAPAPPVHVPFAVAPQPAPAQPQYAPAPVGVQYAQPQYAQPQYAQPQHAQPQHAQAPAPVQYAQAPAPQQYAAAPAPVQYAQAPTPQQYAAAPAPVQYAQAPAPQQYAAAPAPVQYAPAEGHPGAHAAAPATPAEEARRTSRAPKGMGSSLRLDDPSIRDTMDRARSERAGLAAEYQRQSTPLVDTGSHGAPAHEAQPQPQYVGHDPSGVPLFATPGVPGVHPLEQYPAPASLPAAHAAGMPRPVVTAPNGVPDPALRSNAFQRSTPYAPAHSDAAGQPIPAGVG